MKLSDSTVREDLVELLVVPGMGSYQLHIHTVAALNAHMKTVPAAPLKFPVEIHNLFELSQIFH